MERTEWSLAVFLALVFFLFQGEPTVWNLAHQYVINLLK
jgi:hypothetical protein